MSDGTRRTLPWSLSDARTTLLTTIIGAVLVGWAWWDASGTGKLADQTNAAVLAVFGGVMVVTGAVVWLTAGRRAVRTRRAAVTSTLEEPEFAVTAPADGACEPTGAFVALPSSARYHRATCLLVQGKDAERLAAGTPAVNGRMPCEMCEP